MEVILYYYAGDIILLCRCQEAGSCYLVNATTWLGPLDVVQPVYGFIMPVLMCITFIFNTGIIIVLSRLGLLSTAITMLHLMTTMIIHQAQHDLPHQHRPAVHGRV